MEKTNLMFPSPPASLIKLPKHVLRKLDASHAVLSAIDARNNLNGLSCSIAISRITSTLSAAKVQQRRIIRAKKSISKWPRTGRHTLTLFHEVHFYLICWARIAKLARFVVKVSGFRRAKFVLNQYRTRLVQMSQFRDHLEHFEERLPGGSRHHLLKVPGDLFNMVDEFATIGGERINVGTESLRLLITIVEAFKAAVLFDAIERIAQTDPSKVSFLIRRATLDVRIARTIKHAQRELRKSSPKTQSRRLTGRST